MINFYREVSSFLAIRNSILLLLINVGPGIEIKLINNKFPR